MKNSKNKSLILTIVALAVVVLGIGVYMTANQENLMAGQNENQEAPAENEEPIHIGLLQYTSHPSLDSISQGIIDTLAENGYIDGERITLDYQNGQGDQSNLNTMSTRFTSNEADLMIAVATPAAQALANASSDIPVLLGAISAPEHVGLVESNEAPGGNVTGVSNMSPIDQQISLIRQIQPEAETIGILYSSSEDNSILQADMAEEIAAEHGFETVKRTVSSTNDVAQVTQQLVTEVDAIWTPTDNTVASAFSSVLEVSNEAKIPVYPSVDTMVAQGGLATLGLNQYQIGVETGEMAVELLEGEIEPATEPVRFAEEVDLVINFETAELLGITIPEHLAEKAIDSKELLEVSE